MPFVLSKHYVAKNKKTYEVNESGGSRSYTVVTGAVYRVTGFDFSGNMILKKLKDGTDVRVPAGAYNDFRDTSEVEPPSESAFKGLTTGETGFFEPQKTTTTCWASALSNCIISVFGQFVSEYHVVESLGVKNSTGGPNPEEFLQAIYALDRNFELGMATDIIEAGSITNWAKILKYLLSKTPVICSVNRNTHVVVLLGFTTESPYWVMYYEVTGGTYKKMMIWDFIKFKTPDYAFVVKKS